MRGEIKVMSFNLRVNAECDGENDFYKRTSRILEMLEREKPDIIGFQEAREGMLSWLIEHLTEYVVIGHGRYEGFGGEGTPIAYRKDRFWLHGFCEEWLAPNSKTPSALIEGLDQSDCPRVYTKAELVDRTCGRVLAFFNTHFDHLGKNAQIAESAMLLLRIGDCAYPFVLTGDFNASPDDPAVQMLRGSKSLGTVDATEGIGGTYHGFSQEILEQGQAIKIDHIFTNLSVDPARSYAVPDGNGGLFYSDHLAICSFVSLDGEK